MSDQAKLVNKSRNGNFTQIPNALLGDNRISWKAKGIISYLLGKSSGWVVRMSDLLNQSTDGMDAVRSGIKELCEFGYAEWKIIREEDGTIATRVLEITDEPAVENPSLGKTPREVFPETTNKEEVPIKKRYIRFTKPTITEVEFYAMEIGFDSPSLFFDHYESCGWTVGKKPMVDWRAAMRGWKARSNKKMSVWEISKKIDAIKLAIAGHPCNYAAVCHNPHATQSQKDDWNKLQADLKELNNKLAR